MIVELPFEHMEAAAAYFSRRPCHHTFRLIRTGVKLEFNEEDLPPDEFLRLSLHLKYLGAFLWDGPEPAGFIFGEHLDSFSDFPTDFERVTGDLSYNLLAAVQPGGVLPGEILAAHLGCPLLRFDPQSPSFEPPAATSRVLIVDDLAHSGTALESAAGALRRAGYTLSGAFVLLDILPARRRSAFDFPIRAFLTPF